MEFRQEVRSIVSQQFSHSAHPEAENSGTKMGVSTSEGHVSGLLKGKHKVA